MASVYSQMVDVIDQEIVRASAVEKLRSDVGVLLNLGGIEPDPWQRELLKEDFVRAHVCCSRQSGKSQTAAGLALNKAVGTECSLTLIVSKALRQSSELMRKVKQLYRSYATGQRPRHSRFKLTSVKELEERERILEELRTDEKPVQDSALTLELANGSRIVSLPGNPDTIVGFSAVDLLIIDEAARTPDDLYRALRPMLAVSQGKLVALSTPFGKRGWFYEEWLQCEEAKLRGDPEPWKRFSVKATDCPRITKEFLANEQRALGPRWYRQEYEVSFEEAVGAVFSDEVIKGAIDSTLEPVII